MLTKSAFVSKNAELDANCRLLRNLQGAKLAHIMLSAKIHSAEATPEFEYQNPNQIVTWPIGNR
jgi:hypothetical protein